MIEGVDDAIVGVVEVHVLADDAIAVEVFLGLSQEGAPRAQVAPSEVGGAYEYLLGLLHDGIVNRDALAFGEALVDLLLLPRRAIDGQQALEDAIDGGLIHTEGVDDGAYTPDEDAGIPEVRLVADVFHSLLLAGFLTERIHPEDFLVARAARGEIGLNIAVASFGTCGLHAKRYDGIGLARELHALVDHTAELFTVDHDMIAGRHHHVGLGVFLLDAPTDVGDAGGRVAAARLTKHVSGRHLGQLLAHDVGILLVGHHPHVLRVANAFETIKRQLEKRAPYSQHINKLLGLLGGAHRPETASNAAGHNN